jgi:hypothetical protein
MDGLELSSDLEGSWLLDHGDHEVHSFSIDLLLKPSELIKNDCSLSSINGENKLGKDESCTH